MPVPVTLYDFVRGQFFPADLYNYVWFDHTGEEAYFSGSATPPS